MTGPSNPRGERAGTPGAGWETELRSTGERWVPDGESAPIANRAARRAARRGQKPAGGVQAFRESPAGPQEAREAACVPVSRPNSPLRSGSRQEPENASGSLKPASPNRTEITMPDPTPLQQLLIMVDRGERGAMLPAEAARLRIAIRALYARAYPQTEETAA